MEGFYRSELSIQVTLQVFTNYFGITQEKSFVIEYFIKSEINGDFEVLGDYQASRCLVILRIFSFLFLLPCFFQGLPIGTSLPGLSGATGPLPGL